MNNLKNLIAGAVLVVVGLASAAAQNGGSAAALRETYSTLRSDLEQSAFHRPLRLVSNQTGNTLQGDIHAVITKPFDTVRQGLGAAKNWCGILILDPNITSCQAQDAGAAQKIDITVGKAGTPVHFGFGLTSSEPDYLHVQLSAPQGPLGTKDFRVAFEATPLEGDRTFIHLVYSHGFGLQAQLAMRAYLSTLGRDKVGFTVTGKTADGKPVYVGDVRGALERNAMRYYLAIEAYLEAPQEYDKRVQSWYASVERYPLQLHEGQDYLDRKRKIAAS